MIAHLRGVLLESAFNSCVVDVNGVGYEVAIALSTFDKLPRTGEEVSLFIHTQVREDAITLFGFASAEERELFRALIAVSGIGGKLALNILGAMPAANFRAAVASGDIKALSRINGIGKRTAERLVVELRDKLGDTGAIVAIDGKPAEVNAAIGDTASALEQLGFKRDQINRVLNELINELPESEQNTESLLRAAIIRLNF